MKGLELAQLFYDEIGAPSLKRSFGEDVNRLAVGLVGEGSDCYGYDDRTSQDHDFGPWFDVWAPDGDERLYTELKKWYASLPTTFDGFSFASRTQDGASRHGVQTVGDFYRSFTGSPDGPQTWQEWLYTPSHYLSEATNGKVFSDPSGVFSAVRKHIVTDMPRDVKLKKIAAAAMMMAQSGQYNYARCLKHNQSEAAWLAKSEFVQNTCKILYLFNDAFMPYYKWVFRGMDGFAKGFDIAGHLRKVIRRDGDDAVEEIETVSALVTDELRREQLTDGTWDYLEPHAFAVYEKIQEPALKQLHIMEG